MVDGDGGVDAGGVDGGEGGGEGGGCGEEGEVGGVDGMK